MDGGHESKVPRPRSLRVELVASLAVVLMMAVASLSFASEWLGQRRYHERELARLELHARSVAALASELFATADRVERGALRELLRRSTAAQLGVRAAVVYVVAADEVRLLESVGAVPSGAPTPGRLRNVDAETLAAEQTVLIDEPIAVFSRRQTDVVPVLRLVAMPSPWSDGMYPWHETLIVATGVGAVLLALGGLLLQAKVLQPLRTIEAATAQVRGGDLEVRVPEQGPTEFVSLARSFNAMTEAVREQTVRLDRQHKALQGAEKMATVGRLAAGVAHEVGNPLAAIGGYLDFVLDPRNDEVLGPHTRDVLLRVQTQTQRMQRIIRQLLDYSQPTSGEISRVDLRRQATELCSLVAADPRTKGVDVAVEPGEPILAPVDPGFLQQILLNLVINGCLAAREAGEDTPRVHVRLGADAHGAWIEVQDTGPGVPDAIRGELFEPFVSTRPAGAGTGLGLANSFGLAERMGGKLSCLDNGARAPLADASQAGAVFRLDLPLDRATDPPVG